MIFLIPIDPDGRYHIRRTPGSFHRPRHANPFVISLACTFRRDGNLILINNTAVTVAEACNGARMVFALFMVCYLRRVRDPARWYVRAVLLVASPLVAIIATLSAWCRTILGSSDAFPADGRTLSQYGGLRDAGLSVPAAHWRY